jgi:hypothetical protein
MEKKPEFKRHTDPLRGMVRHRSHDASLIGSNVTATEHCKSQRSHSGGGFRQKYFISDASKEAPEIAQIRDRAGFHTHGKPDQIGYPPGGDPGRICDTPRHARGHAHEWGGAIGQQNTKNSPCYNTANRQRRQRSILDENSAVTSATTGGCVNGRQTR